ncbi:MAG TPA: DUF4178 domain-containing protein, partial [Longimicrobium sp.]|nr:DUF4178 domain-containing protein [Longimicrobium sp.]
MSAPAANCPSCGAPITFTWSMAVQTVCAYCRSVVVRHGVELEALGKASDPPADRSPIQVGTRGRFGDAHFRVTGRIVYEYERGRWNEWHLELADGRTAWLTDSEAQYAVTFAAEATPLPPLSFFRPGRELTVLGTEYTVRERIQARWVAVEGELPFASFDAGEVALVDLVTAGRECATIDFGGETARAFTGAYVEFDDLALTGLRDLPEGAAAGEVRTLNCPGCGGSVEVRTAASVNVVCRHCQRVLDAAHPGLRVLRKFEAGHAAKLHIPIGTRGRLHGVEWEVVGFQVRSVKEEGIAYPWHEYLLFNPRRGFRYLTYENGHWNDEVPLHGAPRSGHASVRYEGRKYRHFASAKATTTWVAGEFPWQVTATDREMVSDYVSPPFSLSSEGTEKERSWTLGEFITGERVWEAFRLPGKPPLPIGIAPNQPYTGGAATAQLWKGFAAFAALCLVALLVRLGAQGPEVARQTFAHTPSAADLAAESGPAGAVSLRPADAPPTPLIPARAEAPAEPAAPA